MAIFSLNISYTIIQGDIILIDRSQTTTNVNSFNVITTTRTSQSTRPASPLESTPRAHAPFDDISSPSANTMSHQQSGGISQSVSASRRMSTSMEVPESLSGNRIRNLPAQQKKLGQRVFNKLKEWFNRFSGLTRSYHS